MIFIKIHGGLLLPEEVKWLISCIPNSERIKSAVQRKKSLLMINDCNDRCIDVEGRAHCFVEVEENSAVVVGEIALAIDELLRSRGLNSWVSRPVEDTKSFTAHCVASRV